jgi:hypothetical protein
MKRFKYGFTICAALIILMQISCTQYPGIQKPDTQMFKQTVYSPFLRDSLLNGKLSAGMPRFVVDQLFKDWNEDIKKVNVPVASLGSKQRLEEVEGWERKYVDPNAKVFLDEYKTKSGILYVWYQRPDFYTMDVSARDTLCIFLEDTVLCSVINYLNKSSVLAVRDSLDKIPVHRRLYAEVHHNDHPWRKISYWYNIEILSNAKTFKTGEINYELYPIEFLEFDNEPVSSFNWKELIKNEN